ncbi:MAG: homocysteine S-methyltransferase family protein, partial [Clostridiales bacterium]|nr:homocysteine S-methyltransferase family protein [Clostridiales bacterium]
MFKDYLKNNNVLLDGAMGTMLQRRGHKLGEFPETLNVTKPQAIIDIHAEYVRAGARVLYANTFGANGVKLAGSGYTAPELITAGVRLCREAAGENAFVALDIGPTGQLIDNFGTLKFEDAYNAFREAAIAGERAGCDLAVIETMTDLSELRAAVLAVKENTALPVVATMTFEGSGRTFTGVTPAAFAVTATGLSVDALGVNCSLGPRDLYGIVEELAEYTDLPLVVKANAGLPDMNGVYSVSPADFARACARFLSMGVSVIGGCCGTTP